jgi:tetratricopeptide (TPR) repeat protein
MARLAQRQACALFAVAALAAGIAPACAYDVEAAAKAFRLPSAAVRPLTVQRGWQGLDSAIALRGFERIGDVHDWRTLWKRHAPETAAPAVDFDLEMVIAIFGGKRAAGGDFLLYSVTESDAIEVVTMSYGTDVIRRETSNPYLLLVVSKSSKPVSVLARSYCLMCAPQLLYSVMQESPQKKRDDFLRIGDELRSESKWDRAIDQYNRAIEIDPDVARAWHGRGTAWLAMDRYDRAIVDLDHAIRLNPDHPASYNNRCWALAVSGRDLAKALADCDQSLRLDPGNSDAIDSRGFVKLRLGRTEEAIADFTAAIDRNPKLASALYGRGVARLKTDAAAGNADISAAKAIQPDIATTFLRYGVKPE